MILISGGEKEIHIFYPLPLPLLIKFDPRIRCVIDDHWIRYNEYNPMTS
jgi:hypothetical protein